VVSGGTLEAAPSKPDQYDILQFVRHPKFNVTRDASGPARLKLSLHR
jgi:hypothetical protein